MTLNNEKRRLRTREVQRAGAHCYLLAVGDGQGWDERMAAHHTIFVLIDASSVALCLCYLRQSF